MMDWSYPGQAVERYTTSPQNTLANLAWRGVPKNRSHPSQKRFQVIRTPRYGQAQTARQALGHDEISITRKPDLRQVLIGQSAAVDVRGPETGRVWNCGSADLQILP